MYGIGGIIRCLWGYPYRGLEGSPHRMIPERMEAEIVINRQEVLGGTFTVNSPFPGIVSSLTTL